MFFAEIRPINLREEPFAVNRLPDQKVARALFAGGADDEIWVGGSRSEHGRADPLDVDLIGFGALFDQLFDRADDLITAAVIESQDDVDAGIVFGQLDRVFDLLFKAGPSPSRCPI